MKTASWKAWKIAITVVLALIVAADAGLAIFLWRDSRHSPAVQQVNAGYLEVQAKLFQADVGRGSKIRESLPQVGRDCDRFYREAFLDPGTGYSEIESDLDEIASKSGLKMGEIQYKRADWKDRGVTELTIDADVQGSYSAVIQFINGIERSKRFYLLQDLALQSASNGGGIRLALQLRTFFRMA